MKTDIEDQKIFNQLSAKTHDSFIADTAVNTNTNFLQGKKITIVSGGGIAAIEAPRLARELRRHGASIHFFVTETCLKFIGIESLRWASGNEVTIQPSGLAEHICTSDAVVVAPATADLISKSRHGICSDGASTLIQSAMGLNKPIIFCQTMHNSLAKSPIIQSNIEDLKKFQFIYFTQTRQEEGKEKIPSPDILAIDICHIINKHVLKKSIYTLISFGGTRTMIDPVRCLTNLSTGKLGFEIIKNFYANGFLVDSLVANINFNLPNFMDVNYHDLPDYENMLDFVKNIDAKKYTAFINLVAGSDFIVDKMFDEKISSQKDLVTINLIKTEKIISQKNIQNIPFKAGAKLTTGLSDSERKNAEQSMMQSNLNAIFWNSSKDVWNSEHGSHKGIFLYKENKEIKVKNIHGKIKIAEEYFSVFKQYLSQRG